MRRSWNGPGRCRLQPQLPALHAGATGSPTPTEPVCPSSCEWPHQGEVCIVATVFAREARGLAGTGNHALSQRPDCSPLLRGPGSGHGKPQRPSASAAEATALPGRDPAAAAGLDALTPSPLHWGPVLRQKGTPARQPNPGRRPPPRETLRVQHDMRRPGRQVRGERGPTEQLQGAQGRH